MNTTSCKLNDLKETKLYQIQIIAVNSITKFRSESSPVYIQTLPKDRDVPECIENIKLDLLNEQPKNDKKDLSDSSLPLDLTVEDIKLIESSEELNNYLLRFQNELIKLKNEYSAYEKNVNEEISSLKASLKSYKKEFEEETDSKTKKDTNIKDLEKQKDRLAFKKSKILNQIKTIQTSIDLFSDKLSGYKVQAKKLEERNKRVLQNELKEILRIKDDIMELEAAKNTLRLDNEKHDETFKKLAAEKKELNSLILEIKPLIEKLNNESMFNKDGSVSKYSIDILNEILQVMPDWHQEILDEISNYQRLDTQWKETFKLEIRRFLSIQHSLEIAKANKDKNYQPNKMTEHQASVEFGGFNNALPKVKKKFSNSSNTSLVYTNEESPINETWHNHYSDVYATNSDDQLNGNLVEQISPAEEHPYIPLADSAAGTLQNLSYEELLYNNNSVFNSPIPDPSVMNILPSMQQESLQSFLHNDQLYGYNSPTMSTSALNSAVWGLGIPVKNDFLGIPNINQDITTPQFRFNQQFNMGMSSSNSGISLNVDQNMNGSNSSFLVNQSSSQVGNNNTPIFSNTLWLDAAPLQHTRNVSSTSNNQIWRHQDVSTHNFHLGQLEPFITNNVSLEGITKDNISRGNNTPHHPETPDSRTEGGYVTDPQFGSENRTASADMHFTY